MKKNCVFVQVGFFERVTNALNVVTPERCWVSFRSVRRYLHLYNSGVTGPEIPKAMSQMRKHRKHRAGNLLDDEENQRGRNSSKRTRLDKLKSRSWNEAYLHPKYHAITTQRPIILAWTVQFLHGDNFVSSSNLVYDIMPLWTPLFFRKLIQELFMYSSLY